MLNAFQPKIYQLAVSEIEQQQIVVQLPPMPGRQFLDRLEFECSTVGDQGIEEVWREIQRKLEGIIAFSELERFIDTPVKRYSSGMYVRLAFAVAAHLEPEILLVDEVLAVGDAQFQKKCLGKMGEVAGEGRTVLFVSHNMGAVQQMCSETLLLTSGITDGIVPTVDAVRKYNGVANQTEYNAFWNHPEPAEGKLFVASVLIKQFDQQTDQIKMSSPFQIEFQLSTEAASRDCFLGIYILDKNHEIIIHSLDMFATPNGDLFQRGRNRLAQVPGHGLAAGDYWLTYWLGSQEEGIWDRSTDVIHWRVVGDSPVMVRFPERDWRGKVGPGLIIWTMKN